ncbi:MAG: SUF system Fe-S cluster assembly protein [Proteobacteria bacterium]|nr:SUF system Fe-S cluster assembly protein [Pseudomonadota bacterium]
MAPRRRPVNDGHSPADAPQPAAPETETRGTWTPEGETPPKPTEDAVIAAIAEVYDPEIPVNIFELGLIYAVEIDDAGAVKVEMTLTAPGCPSAQELPVQVHDQVMTVPGVSDCDVEVVWDPPWHPGRMSEEARLQLNMF